MKGSETELAETLRDFAPSRYSGDFKYLKRFLAVRPQSSQTFDSLGELLKWHAHARSDQLEAHFEHLLHRTHDAQFV